MSRTVWGRHEELVVVVFEQGPHEAMDRLGGREPVDVGAAEQVGELVDTERLPVR